MGFETKVIERTVRDERRVAICDMCGRGEEAITNGGWDYVPSGWGHFMNNERPEISKKAIFCMACFGPIAEAVNAMILSKKDGGE